VTVRKRYPVVALAMILRLGWPGEGRAADLDELSKYRPSSKVFSTCSNSAKRTPSYPSRRSNMPEITLGTVGP
jgi:hypothetical protein